jgi:uncharacterized membrane protein
MDNITATTLAHTGRFAAERSRSIGAYIGKEPLLGFIHPFFAVNILTVLLVALIFYWLVKSSQKKQEPLEVIKRRYALGEIDREAYLVMRKDLSD